MGNLPHGMKSPQPQSNHFRTKIPQAQRITIRSQQLDRTEEAAKCELPRPAGAGTSACTPRSY